MPKSKIIVTGLIALVVAGLAVISVTNTSLIQGKLDADDLRNIEVKLPDLVPTLEVIEPDEHGNVRIKATMENLGEGPVLGTDQYNYSLYLNDELIMTNTDTFAEMAPGNKFSFSYPIDKEIYQYADTGKVRFELDKDNNVEELDENNNMAEADYSL